MKRLVIVESPAKCKKIESFLGQGFRVMASFGHVRDLPDGDLGVDFSEGRVRPRYIANDRGSDVIARLRREAESAHEVILATDPDREGEAIAWHLAESLGHRTYRRATFNAITKKAVVDAIAAPRDIDRRLVDAQQARRVLDRIVGYLVSPTCVRGSGMKEARSAGRVQSVALRIVVEREHEIRQFKPTTFFVPIAHLQHEHKRPPFMAALVEWKGESLDHRLTDKVLGERTVDWCHRQAWVVRRSERRAVADNAPAPFITSTLQQAASVKLKLSPQQTMKLAQELYESGLITYMRTDSPHLSDDALAMARVYIAEHFAKEYLPDRPQVHGATAKSAQEAHEAIRPTAVAGGPAAVGSDLKGQLYRLIFERFIACQMAPGRDQQAVIDVEVAPGAFKHEQLGLIAMGMFRVTGKIILFDGWRHITSDAVEEAGDPSADGGEEAESRKLPDVAAGDPLTLLEIRLKEKTTKAPPRYTEASLIKALEKRGVGRPSTYASIMTTITGRGYVVDRQRKLHSTDVGEALCAFLMRAYAGNFIEVDFTNRVEDDLDRIALGQLQWEPYIHDATQNVLRLAQAAGLTHNPLKGEAPPWASRANTRESHKPPVSSRDQPRQKKSENQPRSPRRGKGSPKKRSDT